MDFIGKLRLYNVYYWILEYENNVIIGKLIIIIIIHNKQLKIIVNTQ